MSDMYATSRWEGNLMKPESKKPQSELDDETNEAALRAWEEEERERCLNEVINMTPVYDEINGLYYVWAQPTLNTVDNSIQYKKKA